MTRVKARSRLKVGFQGEMFPLEYNQCLACHFPVLKQAVFPCGVLFVVSVTLILLIMLNIERPFVHKE